MLVVLLANDLLDLDVGHLDAALGVGALKRELPLAYLNLSVPYVHLKGLFHAVRVEYVGALLQGQPFSLIQVLEAYLAALLLALRRLLMQLRFLCLKLTGKPLRFKVQLPLLLSLGEGYLYQGVLGQLLLVENHSALRHRRLMVLLLLALQRGRLGDLL